MSILMPDIGLSTVIDGTKIKNAINEFVFPGDMIEVPPSLLYQLVGGDGVIKTLASIASSAYIIYKFTEK